MRCIFTNFLNDMKGCVIKSPRVEERIKFDDKNVEFQNY